MYRVSFLIGTWVAVWRGCFCRSNYLVIKTFPCWMNQFSPVCLADPSPSHSKKCVNCGCPRDRHSTNCGPGSTPFTTLKSLSLMNGTPVSSGEQELREKYAWFPAGISADMVCVHFCVTLYSIRAHTWHCDLWKCWWIGFSYRVLLTKKECVMFTNYL